MIKITTELNQINGFTTTEAVLVITNYTKKETVVLSTGHTMPMLGATEGKNISFNYLIYKSETDKNDGKQPFQPQGFPINLTVIVEDFSEDVEELLSAELTNKGYAVEII